MSDKLIEYRSHATRDAANVSTWESLEQIPARRSNFYALYLEQDTGRLYTVRTTRKRETEREVASNG
jgi:hypothetical protein